MAGIMGFLIFSFAVLFMFVSIIYLILYIIGLLLSIIAVILELIFPKEDDFDSDKYVRIGDTYHRR